MNGLWLLVAIGVLVWFWLDSARARELATGLANEMCRKRGLQFLDETVSQTRFGLRWTSNGLRFRRMFSFDFSMEGLGRRSGWLILLGTQVEQFDLGLPKPSDSVQTEPGRQESGKEKPREQSKVIPFKRPKE